MGSFRGASKAGATTDMFNKWFKKEFFEGGELEEEEFSRRFILLYVLSEGPLLKFGDPYRHATQIPKSRYITYIREVGERKKAFVAIAGRDRKNGQGIQGW